MMSVDGSGTLPIGQYFTNSETERKFGSSPSCQLDWVLHEVKDCAHTIAIFL